MPNMKVNVSAKKENPTKTVVKARNFEMIIDEPSNLGGTDHGANPVEYVLASLAGCLNVVGHVVAKEMGFEIKNLEIELDGELNPARFMGKSDKERAGYQAINVKMKPETDADEDTLKTWIEKVESRCPVSDNLANATPVNITL
ncbi:OsmC family protein [Geotoga petraea]|uniref:OsmC family peroxiredoxin n=1 Tax=Geotoga petraea TaxID=28234 RepID=A0A4Z0W416_9BACT|nr:OsmC family protein [Geotoga petraea]TGG88670.1 OsmC family peroxiredoxin [Geotoga petraea]